MRIVVINTVVLNGGDAAILLGALAIFKQAFGDDCQVVVFDHQAAIASRYYRGIDFRQMYLPGPSWYLRVAQRLRIARAIRRLESFFWLCRGWLLTHGWRSLGLGMTAKLTGEHSKQYESADVIASTGGTYLVEQYEIKPRIDHLQLAAWSGKPVVMLTQSLGPFLLPVNRRALQRVLPAMSAIFLRDELSRRHIEDLGLRLPHVYLAADAAFALADEERVRSLARKPVHHPIKVAVSVRDWPYFQNSTREEGMRRYRDSVAATVQHLIFERRAEVTFISTCQGIPEYWTDDSRVARQIVNGLAPEVQSQITVDGDFHTTAQLLDILAGFDLVIATRMHMGILALVAGTPVFPIAYEFKTVELFQNLGLPRWVEDIENLDPTALPFKVQRFIQELPTTAPILVERVLEQRSSALASAAILRHTVKTTGSH